MTVSVAATPWSSMLGRLGVWDQPSHGAINDFTIQERRERWEARVNWYIQMLTMISKPFRLLPCHSTLFLIRSQRKPVSWCLCDCLDLNSHSVLSVT